ncbi:MAG: HAMP domain-containing sensor histidine kinase [Kofleriaceae bacterium]
MRLVVRIWLHGFVLFLGVTATVMVARFVMSREDAILSLQTHPTLALGLGDRVLGRRDDPVALQRELGALRHDVALVMTVYRADGALIASSADPPLAPATAFELEALRAREMVSGRRLLVGALAAGAVEAYVVARMPSRLWPLHVFLLLATAILLALVFVAMPMARSIARPLEKLGALTRALGAGDLTVRAPVGRRDEIGMLGRAFNDMAAQIQRLRAAERQLLADVSHELRTPLARIRVVLDLASDADLEKVQRYHAEITTDLSELELLLDDIIVSSRLELGASAEPPAETWTLAQPPLRTRAMDLAELLDATTTRFRARWPNRRLVCEDAAPFAITGDPAILRRALDNLVDNARKYSPDDAPIELRVAGDPGGVRIEVIDHGAGIELADQPRVFTPFFRADRSRTRATGGVGLGLTLARRIVEAHGGTIGFASEPGRGSRFWFVLPVAPSAPAYSGS